jgi:hypothetical protein
LLFFLLCHLLFLLGRQVPRQPSLHIGRHLPFCLRTCLQILRSARLKLVWTIGRAYNMV